MQDRQKIKQACVMPLDIWKEEINLFVKNISAKMNVKQGDLLDWIHGQGRRFFSESQQNCYLDLLQNHGFPQVTIAYMNKQIREGFNLLYQNLLKEFSSLNNTTKKSVGISMFDKNGGCQLFR